MKMNNRGIALILTYVVILVLTIFASAFVTSTISENTVSTRQNDSTRAFWIAEAGLNQAYYNWKNGFPQPEPARPVNFSGGTYTIDTSNLLAVKVTGTFGGSNTQRTIQASFLRIPPPFQNTLSVGGDLTCSGAQVIVSGGEYVEVRPSILKVDGKTRISGKYKTSSEKFPISDWFEDIKQGVDPDDTTLKIPDYNRNGKPDEYEDFVQMGRRIVSSYPANEVIYINTDSYRFPTVRIIPLSEISGKKVIFVEDSTRTVGVTISSAPLEAGDDLTVITTGAITYYGPYHGIPQPPTNARLSTLSWGPYIDNFSGQREGVVYTHDWGKWLLTPSSFTGNIIVNKKTDIDNINSLQLHYSDRVLKGDIPPGFKWLFGTKGKPKLVDWQEAE